MKFAYIQKPLPFFLGVCAIAWAIGFVRYFDHWVFFSAFPNILDSLGMSLVGVYLLYLALRNQSLASASLNGPGPILSIFDDIDPAEES